MARPAIVADAQLGGVTLQRGWPVTAPLDPLWRFEASPSETPRVGVNVHRDEPYGGTADGPALVVRDADSDGTTNACSSRSLSV
jgi:hypothetical protein